VTDATVTAGPQRPAHRATGLWIVAGAATLWLLYKISDILLIAFVAGLLAVYLASLTDLLCRRIRLPRGLGLLLSLLWTVAVLVGIGALLVPAVVQQVQDLIAAIPQYITALDHWIRGLAAQYPLVRRSGIASGETGLIPTAFAEVIAFARRSVLAYATGTGDILIHVVAVIVMALYLAWHPDVYRDLVVQMVPPRSRGAANAMLLDVAQTLRSWVGAQLLAMVVLAILTGFGLWLLDVPYWLAFSLFAGIVVMVPFFGSIVSTLIPALLILPDRGPLIFLAVALVGVVVHVIEANVVHPVIMQHRVALPPVVTILGVLIMGRLGGMLGLLVAVPTVATAFVVVRHVLIYRVYGERPADSEPFHAVLRPSAPAMPAIQE
jgi:predicted PurR-regulated permease PerM